VINRGIEYYSSSVLLITAVVAVVPKTVHVEAIAFPLPRVHPSTSGESESVDVSRSDSRHMDTIQRFNALWEGHAQLVVAPPMTKAPVAHPKRVDCPSLRHCHREPSPNRHQGNAHATKAMRTPWSAKTSYGIPASWTKLP
jgi:hypothetical protein